MSIIVNFERIFKTLVVLEGEPETLSCVLRKIEGNRHINIFLVGQPIWSENKKILWLNLNFYNEIFQEIAEKAIREIITS